MKKTLFIASGILFFSQVMLVSCSSDDAPVPGGEPNEPSEPESVTEVIPEVPKVTRLNLTKAQETGVKTTNDFSLNLFNAIAKNYDDCIVSEDRNFSVSPFSASTLLSMSANYFWQPTSNALVSALGYQSLDDMNGAVAEVCAYLMTDGNTGMDFKVSNSLWWRKDYREYLDTRIVETLKDKYYTYSGDVDFTKDETIDLINDWISSTTNNKITHFFDYFAEEEKEYVYQVNVNTVYVYSEWRDKFDAADTKEATFHGTTGDSKVDMMHSDLVAGYMENDAYKCVSLPFAGTADMTIVMPKMQSAEEFSKGFGSQSLAEITMGLKDHKVKLAMPKFKIESTVDIKDNVLIDAGISLENAKNILFGEYSAVRPSQSQMRQKTLLTINEDGAEMAAATSMITTGSTGETPEYENVSIDIDSPFLYFITESRTGAVIMAGRICNL